MSTSLYWRPAPKDVPPADTLPSELKKALARRYWDHDGSMWADEREFDSADVPYLEGLRDAGLDGAAELIAAIKKHGRVEVWIAG